MKTLIIINTITIWLVIIFLIIKPYISKFEIRINKTFWEKKPYGITIMKWKYSRNICSNSGKDIFVFNWKNPERITDNINKRK